MGNVDIANAILDVNGLANTGGDEINQLKTRHNIR